MCLITLSQCVSRLMQWVGMINAKFMKMPYSNCIMLCQLTQVHILDLDQIQTAKSDLIRTAQTSRFISHDQVWVTFLTQLEEFRVNFGTIVGCVTTKALSRHDQLLINVDQPWSTIIAEICFQCIFPPLLPKALVSQSIYCTKNPLTLLLHVVGSFLTPQGFSGL